VNRATNLNKLWGPGLTVPSLLPLPHLPHNASANSWSQTWSHHNQKEKNRGLEHRNERRKERRKVPKPGEMKDIHHKETEEMLT